MNFLSKIFGTHSEREVKIIMPVADKVMSYEKEYSEYTDAQLKAKTKEFKKRLSDGETLDNILPEAFATVREAAWRVLGMKHFKVQVIGGIVLHQGRISEMKTGEGKTLVATLPAYLNALSGKGVHIVTVNDYLAKRDSEWMGKVYKFLGLSVGLVLHDMDNDTRREAYNADITYVTNNELGFDYLRDNMVIYASQMVQRGHNYAIVDEVDSILIDEARTPLIISGMGDKSTQLYEVVDRFARSLKMFKIKESDDKTTDDDIDADYIVDEKANTATLTLQGVKKAEAAFNVENLTDPENMLLHHHINQAIKAHGTMHRDRNYVVKDNQVIIVDEFTGRMMAGRRYSDGLHQAIEAKEHVKVERESKTLATITFQNFFRLYKKLSGMTGTAETEEEEFREIYKLDVVVIPTNKPLMRKDENDVVYKNQKGKLNAVVNQIEECHSKGQPVLVGTITIDKSEELSDLLKKRGIKHNVLNAKFHDKEAEIVSQAGKFGAVTIATNMAGRGTDIMLGGNPEFMAKDKMRKLDYSEELINEATGYADTDDEEIIEARNTYTGLYKKYKEETDAEREKVVEAGGLYIIGTERHESRRIDNQLRGRSGRQGDVGASRFFISLQDDLMRLFGSDRLMMIVDRMGIGDDDPIDAKILSNTIENAQKKIEGKNFDVRKHVLNFDDVMNSQREIIYGERQKVLEGANFRENIMNMAKEVVDNIVATVAGGRQFAEDWTWESYETLMLEHFGIVPDFGDRKLQLDEEEFKNAILEEVESYYSTREKEFGIEENGEYRMREIERIILLRVVDKKWMDHIDAMDQLKNGIGLRAYAQHDPVVEYKIEGMDMFEEMVNSIREETIMLLFHAKTNEEMKREKVAEPVTSSHGDESLKKQPVKKGDKIGRNDPCPCGSGLKYKKCCGKNV
ncbi:MAG: preprotein translocase subunit SecA [Clostridia bacterium]|nr:preprotein translocase subunit SecA [Clostridia bacterium]